MQFVKYAAIALVTGAMACGGGDDPTNPGNNGGGVNTCTSTSTSVQVLDNRYSPACTTVPAGSTVNWTWGGAVSNLHTVTFPTGETSPQQTSGTFSRTFTAAGTYNYLCTVHGAAMSGRIVVE